MKATGHSAAGKSIIEMLWEELDSIMDRLMEDGRPEDSIDWISSPEIPEDKWELFTREWLSYGEERGQAQGVAYALAVMLNPYEPSVPNVKQEAMERWEQRHEND